MRNLNDFINYSDSQTVIDLTLKICRWRIVTKIKKEGESTSNFFKLQGLKSHIYRERRRPVGAPVL